MPIIKSVLESKKMTIMSYICFITAIVLIFRNPENWEMITLLLSFSFFPDIMKEFIIRKYNLPSTEAKNEGEK